MQLLEQAQTQHALAGVVVEEFRPEGGRGFAGIAAQQACEQSRRLAPLHSRDHLGNSQPVALAQHGGDDPHHLTVRVAQQVQQNGPVA